VFDERILSVLKDGKPRFFTHLLSEVGFSHNALKLHLDRLRAEGLVVKEKTRSYGLGRPKFAYLVPLNVRKRFPRPSQTRPLRSCIYLSVASSTFAGSRRADTAKKPGRTAIQKTAHRYRKTKNKNH
jgi:predicted ArsR family transcriptional regulator